ncbi:polymer-forming cytoskeletal protein [Paenibacillus sp. P96]|uniref:Polymer-forming cytoskeletal protein n=1 Tax=Paenibacillus zeirhizosphaerae TaxID=2987519 RepID=A0ABT9FW30_9BACL|nr:polymer-forming cytoskeletal protein [Paenibacillus sp. P96]MDP4098939.1 polymer-forming cytoskeletal protein [Paenibacillus sp. P96]
MFKAIAKPVHPISTDTLLSSGSSFEGMLHSEAPLRIEGRYQGEIKSTNVVVIGESAVVQADINAAEVVIAGKVFGNIRADKRVTITSTGELYGNLTSNTLVIIDGGIMNGFSQMTGAVAAQTGELPDPQNGTLSTRHAAEAG